MLDCHCRILITKFFTNTQTQSWGNYITFGPVKKAYKPRGLVVSIACYLCL